MTLSETYTPRVGDKVRATLGENVLVGRVHYVSASGCDLDVGVDSGEKYALWADDPWLFERVVSVPSKFGAVIRRADGVKFVLVYHDSTFAGWMRSDDDDACSAAYATDGGFTVLFDGVDE